MTTKQEAKYWALWKKVCAAQGWKTSDSEKRHEAHVKILGFDISHKHMENKQVDRIFNGFKLLINPDDLNAVLFFGDPAKEEKKRLLWRIGQLAPPAYVKTVSDGKFGTIHYEDLNAIQLEQLRNTLANRMGAKRRRDALAGETEAAEVPQMETESEELIGAGSRPF